MSGSKPILTLVGILAGAVLAGCAIGWLNSREDAESPPVTPATSPSTSAPKSQPAIAPEKSAEPMTPTNSQTANSEPTVTATNWDAIVQSILDADTEDADKAKKLFALFPKLPPDEQAAVAEDLSELVPDTVYAPMENLLKDAKLPTPVLDVLMADALGRPDSVKLPLMLDLARNPDHAKAADAKDILESYLGEDDGTDWDKWQQAITAWLKENPD